ncbi:MAG: ureidoglycolate lyase [Melioribacteraceae bacterium]|nr:ureidoglycolate lyase [Melioribacteraceae bacterium]
MKSIKTKIVDKINFGKFGEVVKFPNGKTTSEDNSYKFWSNIANYKIEGKTEIGICTVYKQNKNIIEGVERHLHTPEILIPIDAPFVLPLLLEGDSEVMMESFKVEIGEAVVVNETVWHGACLPVGKDSASYFVIFRLNTPNEDVEKKSISPTLIEIE